MKALSILALTVVLGASAFAQEKKADPKQQPKTEAAPPQGDLMDQVELYALQRASDDFRAASQVAQQKQQVMSQIASSIQQKKGCRIQERDGKLGCWAQSASAKK